MHNLLEEFWEEIIHRYPNFDDVKFIEDRSEFNVVDGEEGDYGIIKYFTDDLEHNLILTRTKDGDDYEYKFSDFGKSLLKPLLFKKLNDIIDEL